MGLDTKKPNDLLRRQREQRGWSLQRVADELEKLGGGTDSKQIGKWERGVSVPSPFYREKLCILYGLTADKLGFIKADPDNTRPTLSDQSAHSEQVSALIAENGLNRSFSLIQQSALLVRELGDYIMASQHDPSKRIFLQQMVAFLGASLGTSMVGIPQGVLNPEHWDRLTFVLKKPSRVDEKTLIHLENLNDVCWNLSNSNQLELVEQILPIYLPRITAIAQQSSQYQQRAASLATKGYTLAAEIDKKNIVAMQSYCQQALFYSDLSEDPVVQVAALRQEATIALVAKQPLKALTTYQKTLPLLDRVSPLLRSRIYLGLASASARCGQKQDALTYLGLAHQDFPAQPENDPAFLYTLCNESVLRLYEALTYNDLEESNNSWKILMKVDGVHPKVPVTESARIEFINLQARTAAMLGNMEESCAYIQASVDAADASGYSIWREEAAEIYQELVKLWPYELQVRRLGKLFQKAG